MDVWASGGYGVDTNSVSIKHLRTLYSHSSEVFYVCFSADGKNLASAASGGSVVVHDTDGYKRLYDLLYPYMITKLAYSPDNARLAICTYSGRVFIYDTNEKCVLAELKHDGRVADMMFTPDGWNLITLDNKGNLNLWDQSFKSSTAIGGFFAVKPIALSPDGKLFAYAEHGVGVFVATFPDLDTVSLYVEPAKVHRLIFSPDASEFLVVTNYNALDAVDTYSCKRLHRFDLRVDYHYGLACYSPDGGLIATCGTDGCIYLWDYITRNRVAKVFNYPGFARTVVFSPDGRKIAIAAGHSVQLFSIEHVNGLESR